MKYSLKSISREGIPEALAKAERYRLLKEPGEAESICRDVLTADPDTQAALRMLGLAITDGPRRCSAPARAPTPWSCCSRRR